MLYSSGELYFPVLLFYGVMFTQAPTLGCQVLSRNPVRKLLIFGVGSAVGRALARRSARRTELRPELEKGLPQGTIGE